MKTKGRRGFLTIAVLLILGTLTGSAPPAQACLYCFCEAIAVMITRGVIVSEHQATRQWMTTQTNLHKNAYVIGWFFQTQILRSMAMMAQQLEASGLQAVSSFGTFLDAQAQIDSQRLLQEKAARAFKDYQPSTQMCTFGTLSKSLAATSRGTEAGSLILSDYITDRQAGNINTATTRGSLSDKPSRLQNLSEGFCDSHSFNGSLDSICNKMTSGPYAMDTTYMIDTDVDYARTVLQQPTLYADFTDGVSTGPEEAILALATNLYGTKIFEPVAATVLGSLGNQLKLLDMRAIEAKRNVAAYSFNYLVGTKNVIDVPGSGNDTIEYAENILKSLGFGNNDVKAMLEDPEGVVPAAPSYNALMLLLTKKIYQDPAFYTNLYTTPANVDRTGASLRAISLMQDMDVFKSKLRTEGVLSVLLEMRLREAQGAIVNRMGRVKPTGVQ